MSPEQVRGKETGPASDVWALGAVLYEMLADDLRQSLIRKSTDNLEAYNLYLQGRFEANRRTAEGFNQSLHCFEKALRLDPAFAPALSGLADSHLLLAVYSVAPAKEHMPRAAELSRRALGLDPDLAEAHTSLGSVQALFLRDEEAAERSFRKAIELEPRLCPYPTTASRPVSWLRSGVSTRRSNRGACSWFGSEVAGDQPRSGVDLQLRPRLFRSGRAAPRHD